MNLYRDEIIKRLLKVDSDMSLIDNTPDIYSCVIVGGGALVLMKKIVRSTHDIDTIKASEQIKPLLEAYNINMNVTAYLANFPDDYLTRIVKVDIPTKRSFFIPYLLRIWLSQNCVQ